MITVHHLENSRSQRVLWLLEELGVAYKVKRYERDKITSLAPASLKAVHPLGKSPVIEADGQIVAETGAIIEFLIDRHGPQLRPPAGSPEHLQYTYWMHFAEGSLMTQLILKLFFGRIKEAKMPFFAKPIAGKIADQVLDGYVHPNLASQMSFVEAHLAKNVWFAGGAMSGADFIMSFPLEAARERAGLGAGQPKILAYLDRIHSRPAYERALKQGGPYAYA